MRLLKNKQYTGPLPEMDTFELVKLSKDDQVLYTTQYQKRYQPPNGRKLLGWSTCYLIPSLPSPILSDGKNQKEEKEDKGNLVESAIPVVQNNDQKGNNDQKENNVLDTTAAKGNLETDDQGHSYLDETKDTKDRKASCLDCGEKESHCQCHGSIMKTDISPVLQNNDEKVHMDRKTELEKVDTDSECHSDPDSCESCECDRAWLDEHHPHCYYSRY